MYKQKIVKIISDVLDKQLDGNVIEEPRKEFGDYAFPCFSLSKEMRKDPKKIATEISEKIKEYISKKNIKFIKKIKVDNAYINFFIDEKQIAEDTLKKIYNEKTNFGKRKEKGVIVIEHTAPNTNKPLHLGHLRNMFIGSSLSRILKHNSYDVKEVNLNNDRGIHICKSMVAYKHFGKGKTPESEGMKPDHFVGYYYVLYNKKLKDMPELEQEAKEMLRKWEMGDKETVELWKKINKWALEGFKQTFDIVGIKFDKQYYESKFYKKGKKMIMDAYKRGIFKKDETGAIYADLEKFNLPNKVLLRGDGTSLYITQDIVLAKLRYDDFKFDKSIYVVGSEQDLYFRILFKLLEMMGFGWYNKCYHLSYGMVYLPEGKMKSREGKVVDADDLIDKMIKIAEQEVKKRYNLPEQEIKKRAKTIGIAALKFFMLKTDHERDINFDPKKSISFEGETGPYIQYSYARANSIIKKYKEKNKEKINLNIDFSLFNEQEIDIIKKMSKFPEIIRISSKEYKPSLIAHYLIEIAQQFNEFYHKHRIIDEKNKDIREARLLLVYCFKYIIKIGLSLFGIDVLEEM